MPNDIFQVAEIPRTLSGKKQELPIKKLLLGHPLEKVLNREAMANPGCLDWYVAFAKDPGRLSPPAPVRKPAGWTGQAATVILADTSWPVATRSLRDRPSSTGKMP